MGSKVIPYFILNAEKVTNPREIAELEHEQLLKSFRQTPTAPPITPAPSGLSAPSDEPIILVKAPKKKRKVFKYKISVKALKKRSTLNTRMELIKEKLEKSRERFKQKKDVSLLREPDDNCVPTVIGLNGELDMAPALDRSVSDLTGVKPKKNADGTFPYVYFVVSDNKVTDKDNDDPKEEGETVKKSASKKRRVRIVEDNKGKLEKKEQMAKMQGLARELGLKSVVDPKPPDSNVRPQASVNQIVFPDTITPQQKSKYANELPTTKSNLHSTHHSPIRPPPGTPATYLSDKTGEHQSPDDVDDSVPRKPFLSGPLYAGKNRSLHSCSLQTFELPNISPEQKRRALGLGSSTNFDEFAYPKPKLEQRDRKVSFADQLPIIRGSGFVFSGAEARDELRPEMPSLGPRAHTVGSISLPSERVDKQALCQRFLLNENVSSARTMRRSGVPLPLPKIDIVSNVYDEMIIKMIQEYLQVSNTPSRQSQLARELLVHLQKHNDNMREITVPTVNITRESAVRAEQESALQLHKKARHAIFREMDLYPPPNTAEGDAKMPKQMTPVSHDAKFVIPEDAEAPTEEENKGDYAEEGGENMPVVEITIRNKTENEIPPEEQNILETNMDSDNQLPRSAKSGRSLKSRERPEVSPITPVSFQMAPPGLSKEDTNLSLKT